MGNRATIVFSNEDYTILSPAVYLHWNGGPESVYRFLDELDRRGARPDQQDYEAARFIQVVADFFGRENMLSLGVSNGPASANLADLDKIPTDHGDNGLYLVTRITGKRKVRRFIATGVNWNFKELSPKKVESERKKAYKVASEASEIPRFFDSIRSCEEVESA
jgi:hypothetical protein